MIATAAGRRARFGLLTLVMALAVTASAVIAAVIGERTSIRFDATDTGEHHLAPKTARLLAHLSHDYEVVLAVNHNEMDPRARQRVADVADLIARASPRITITSIDTASASGLARFDALVARLAERDREAIQNQLDAIAQGAAALEDEADYFSKSLPAALNHLAEAAAPAAQGAAVHEYFARQATAAAGSASVLTDSAQRSRQTVQTAVAGAARLPATDAAAGPLAAALLAHAAELEGLRKSLELVAESEDMPAGARDTARSIGAEVAQRRDRTARLADSIGRLRPLDLQRIARALEASSAVLVVGPAGVGLSAIEPTSLFPPAEQIDLGAGVQADLRRKAEDLFATAIGLLEVPLKPIIVLVHGEVGRVLDDRGPFSGVVERMRLQGIDIAEWPVVLENQPPSLAGMDPGGLRPVVFVVLSTDASQTFSNDPNLAGPSRAAKLGEALDGIVAQGEPLLLCLAPSTLPSYGQADPMTAPLALFGLSADTARPILHEVVQPAGRIVQTDHAVRAQETDHPIYRAVQGLPTVFPWPVAVRETDSPAGATLSHHTLYSIATGDSWAESQWLGYWQIPPQQRRAVIDPPTPDLARDDTRGPWPIAIAATRSAADIKTPERLVVVGSNTWFKNDVALAQAAVYGQMAPVFPGNAELFEAAVEWLAGKDDLIAQTTTARAVPLIRPLTEGQLSVWRWLVVGGMPLLTLLCGLAWRILRG